jgi:simple sugar transport system permease protein
VGAKNIMKAIGGRLARSQEAYLVVLIVAYALIVNSINHSFLTVENILDILKSSSIMGTMALGVFVVMLSGGIDISFTAIATVASFVTVKILLAVPGSLPVAFLIAAAIGIILGCLNAVIVHFCRMPTLIATLGTSSIIHGAFLSLAAVPYIYTVPKYFYAFGRTNILSWRVGSGTLVGISAMTVTMLAIALVTWIILRYTTLGRGIYALGGNAEAAKRAGLNIAGIQFFIYAFIGLMSGLAAVQYVSLVRLVHPYNLMEIMLDVIAAVVLGGASLTGGRGSVLGTLLGVWMIYLIRNSLVLMKIPSYWDSVIVGLVIVVSTGINAYGRVLSRAGGRALET